MAIHDIGPDEGPFTRGRPGRLLHPGWCVLLALLIGYGSLLPFEWRRAADFTFSDWSWISMVPGSPEDIVVNVLLYAALSALAVCGSRARLGLIRPLAILIGAGLLSGVCELSQHFVASRVTSLADFLCNLAGAAIGIAIGAQLRRSVPRWAASASAAFVAGPYQFASAAMSIALLLYGLAPFDFVTGVDALHRSFGRANLQLSMQFTAIPGNALAEAGWFVFVGLLAAVGAMERARPRGEAVISAVRHGLIVIVVIELMHVLLRSQAYESSAIMLRVAAVTLGAWVGAFWIEPADLPRRLSEVSPHALATAIFLVMAYLIAAGVDGGRLASPGHLVEWLPFVSTWQKPAAGALFELTFAAGCYFALASLLRMAGARGSAQPSLLTNVLMLAGLSVLCEALTWLSGGTAGTTRPLVAMASATAAGRFAEWAGGRNAAAHAVTPSPCSA